MKEKELVLRVGVSVRELVTALQEMDEEERQWFLENLLAAGSPEYLESIREAREDYQRGHTLSGEELFKG